MRNEVREVTMQRCIKVRKLKLRPHKENKIDFDRRYHINFQKSGLDPHAPQKAADLALIYWGRR